MPQMNPTLDMQTSPLDRNPVAKPPAAPLLQLAYTPRQRWIPSRYTSRTVSEDGRLILWNTLSGAISAFQVQDRDAVLERLSSGGVEAPLDKVSEYLSRRGFLVREQTNELDQFRYRYNQEHWRSDKLQLILLASEDCNFRCVYCYEKFRNGTMEAGVRQGIMQMVSSRAPRLSELSVGWFGGEPLYGWEAVEELSPFFRRMADEHGLVHAQNMTTNGYLLTEERATKLLEWGCRSYQITVDGLAAEHDCKRVGRDGSPTHAVILDNLRSLKARDQRFNVAIRVNFDQENVPKLGAFLEALSEDFGGDPRFKMRFRAVGKWGGANDEDLATCGLSEKRQVLRQLRERTDEVKLRQEGGIREAAKFGNQVCYAARPYNFIVSATGKLMKCT
ncbi:MAG TPA: radical SAM protein, partial [Longimicrobium sp.]|nr:radical SAM protein [Longimicrobium sp.]